MDDKQACKENSVEDHDSNMVLYAPHTCQGRSSINTLNTGINIGAHFKPLRDNKKFGAH